MVAGRGPFLRRSAPMFELPPETLLLLLGAPLVWIAYTIVFLFRSRTWDRDAKDSGKD